MRSFRYVRPETLEEVLALLDAHGTDARLLAGGTDLIVRLRLGHVLPAGGLPPLIAYNFWFWDPM